MAIGFITNHPLLTAFVLVGGFCLWKFIIQPTINEGKPLDPDQDQVEGNLNLGLD